MMARETELQLLRMVEAAERRERDLGLQLRRANSEIAALKGQVRALRNELAQARRAA
jgi:hypothetical protein